jgi:hypothetical protein
MCWETVKGLLSNFRKSNQVSITGPWEDTHDWANAKKWSETAVKEVREFLNERRPGLGDQVDSALREKYLTKPEEWNKDQ